MKLEVLGKATPLWVKTQLSISLYLMILSGDAVSVSLTKYSLSNLASALNSSLFSVLFYNRNLVFAPSDSSGRSKNTSLSPAILTNAASSSFFKCAIFFTASVPYVQMNISLNLNMFWNWTNIQLSRLSPLGSALIVGSKRRRSLTYSC